MLRYTAPLFAVAALILAVPHGTPVRADDHKVPKDTCVAENKACAAECLACMKYCIEKGHKEHVKMLEECHHMCLACASAVEGKTHTSWAVCELCEKVCNHCAAMSEKGDDRMKKTAEACRRCAKACADARK